MTSAQNRVAAGAWLRNALLLAVGGVAFTFGMLWLAQGVLGLSGNGRLIAGSSGLLSFGAALLACGLVSLWVLRRLFRFTRLQAWQTLLGWLLVYLVAWIVGWVGGGISLAIFLLLWGLFGVVAGYALAAAPPPRAKASRPRAQLARASMFGRVPADTVVALSQHARHAAGPIAGALPASAPEELRQWTVRAVLTRTLRDWWENDNRGGLEAQDIADLKSFVELAASLPAALAPAEEQAIYRATLSALLDDWLSNWNADGVSGPPRR